MGKQKRKDLKQWAEHAKRLWSKNLREDGHQDLPAQYRKYLDLADQLLGPKKRKDRNSYFKAA